MSDQPEHLKKVYDKDDAARVSSSVFDDLAGLRKAQKITVSRKSVLVNVTVDKPPNNAHFRAHLDWSLDDATVLKDPASGQYYFVPPNMRGHPKLVTRIRFVTLAAIYLWPAGVIQIWPVPQLEGAKRDFKAWKSARAAYEQALEHWTQVVWNEATSDYSVDKDEGITGEPVWPTDKTFNEYLKLGFDGAITDNEDHPYVRQLRGLDT